ncbi:MAG: PHP domain-containing protein [Clostridiales bacterium]|nr:PHP domain-containing protein [Clostridiales bacterium]
MAFWGDYHTHTTYSHGKGSVMDNARVAKDVGLKQVAITDHGLKHLCLGIKKKEFPRFLEDCKAATKETGVHVLAGIENNFNSFRGTLDVPPEYIGMLDIIQGGYHRAAKAPSFGQEFSFQIRNLFSGLRSKSPKKLIAKNTDAYLKLIDNYDIDFIGHINRDIRADAITVAKYAKQKGTYIELNNKNLTITDEELEKMCEEGVLFVVNSDAHRPEAVGNMDKILEVINRLHIPFELIHNWERFPAFRSKNYADAVARFNEQYSSERKENGDGQA